MGLARPLLELNKALFPKIKTGFRNGTRHDSHTGRKSPAASNSKKREQKITDRRIHLKYNPHWRPLLHRRFPWRWTLAFGQHEDRTPTHGYEPTREGAMETAW